jgi:hypothetical protein
MAVHNMAFDDVDMTFNTTMNETAMESDEFADHGLVTKFADVRRYRTDGFRYPSNADSHCVLQHVSQGGVKGRCCCAAPSTYASLERGCS